MMEIRILFVSALLVAGCSKPQAAPSPVGGPPPPQATPAPASQQSGQPSGSTTPQEAPAAPAGTPQPTAAVGIEGNYIGVACSDGSGLDWNRVSFSASDDGASFTITSDVRGTKVAKDNDVMLGHRATSSDGNAEWVFRSQKKEEIGYTYCFSKSGENVTGTLTKPDGSVLSKEFYLPDNGQDFLAFKAKNKFLCLAVSFGEPTPLNSTEQDTLRFINSLFRAVSMQDGTVLSNQRVALYGKKIVFVEDESVGSLTDLMVSAADMSDLDPDSISANNGAVVIPCKGLTACDTAGVAWGINGVPEDEQEAVALQLRQIILRHSEGSRP